VRTIILADTPEKQATVRAKEKTSSLKKVKITTKKECKKVVVSSSSGVTDAPVPLDDTPEYEGSEDERSKQAAQIYYLVSLLS